MSSADQALSNWQPSAQSSVAPFEQLRQLIADLASRGVLPVGYRLPSVRALAASSGLAVNTVARAIKELEQAGIVRTQGRNGTVISAAGDQLRARVAEAAETFAAVVHQQGLSHREALAMITEALKA
ncbi:GntR family transcriptional regulator [Psychromicrobium lacuslunae]|uniref:HTH gntR-type domain-containing protein n=1 Tax=Psychromicrobium lacuslunae TaxID=1618207 RepID=A0A0D4BXK2_9MICC|nr:GntR family transcriptional regulator [Psychromicrobium lacuslunae]AJT40851.1 hypothetical protein UM93_03795 [Psychromicrobium lacuslunae]